MQRYKKYRFAQNKSALFCAKWGKKAVSRRIVHCYSTQNRVNMLLIFCLTIYRGIIPKPPHRSISIPSKAQKWMMPTPKYWQPYKLQKRTKRGISKNEPKWTNFSESLHKRLRNVENIRSINDLEKCARKECKKNVEFRWMILFFNTHNLLVSNNFRIFAGRSCVSYVEIQMIDIKKRTWFAW